MTQNVSRRRFLTDLAFIGGTLLLAAGLGATPTPPAAPEPPPAAPEPPSADGHHPMCTPVWEGPGQP